MEVQRSAIAAHAMPSAVIRFDSADCLTISISKFASSLLTTLQDTPPDPSSPSCYATSVDNYLTTIDDCVSHIMHFHELAGNRRQVALGDDFDGGFNPKYRPDGLKHPTVALSHSGFGTYWFRRRSHRIMHPRYVNGLAGQKLI